MKRNEFLKAARESVRLEPVETPIGVVFVRSMPAGKRDEFEQMAAFANRDKTPVKNVRAFAVIACACNETGEKIFGDSDAAELSELPTEVLDPIFNKALELSGLSPDALEDAKKN